MGIGLEAIEGLRDAVQGCLGMAFGFLEISKISVLDPDIVGVVGFVGALAYVWRHLHDRYLFAIQILAKMVRR
jgi:hypothetical protein